MDLLETNLKNLKLIQRGKVRDIYDLGDNLLFVATDRISAFDFVMQEPISNKGYLLNQISLIWFGLTDDIIDNHVIISNVDDYPKECAEYKDILKGRSMIVKKSEPLKIECIVRGYISGSAWASYKKDKTICGMLQKDNLVESQKFDKPIFTPSTKADLGEHDENINDDEAKKIVGEEIFNKVKDTSIKIYERCRSLAEKQNIIIADTKLEFGLYNGELILIDELCTPDSSRFWDKTKYEIGRSQESFDKQYLRDYLSSVNWDKKSPPPALPEGVIKETSKKYEQAYNLIKNIKV